MNERARDRVVILLGVLRTYPEATGLSIHAASTWVMVSVTVSSDEAVTMLDEDLELGGIEIKKGVSIRFSGSWERADHVQAGLRRLPGRFPEAARAYEMVRLDRGCTAKSRDPLWRAPSRSSHSPEIRVISER